MYKAYIAAAGLAVSVGATTMHFVSHGWVAAENIVVSYAETVKRSKINKWAHENGFVPRQEERSWVDIADEQAEARGVNKCLVRALIKVESAEGKRLVSRAGAMGHMQLMPQTALSECGIKSDMERLDPETNIYCGVKHLARLLKQYDAYKALQVYNAGPARVGATSENRNYPHLVIKEWARCQI